VVLNANTGTGLTYQWRNGTTTITGATAASYTASVSGSYNVVVRNANNCTVTSSNTTVTVKAPLAVSINPTGSVKLLPTSTVTLNAVTSNTGITYQWYRTGVAIASSNNVNFVATQVGDYSVKINDGLCEVTSAVTKVVAAVAPTVAITSPSNNTNFTAPASFNLSIAANDIDGTVSKVDVYQNNVKVSSTTTAPYQYAVSNLTTGTYQYYVIATDNDGLTTTSTNIAVNVTANQPPVVTMNAVVTSNQDIDIDVTANDPENKSIRVEIYDGTTLLTTLNNAPYLYTILAPSAGIHNLTIKAIDADGVSTVLTKSVTVLPKVTTSINGQQNISAQVYPNPFTEQVRIEAKGSYTYELHNTLGQLIMNGSMNDVLEIGGQLPNGTYMLFLKNDNQMKCIPIIKN
jgi:hypothetical protein